MVGKGNFWRAEIFFSIGAMPSSDIGDHHGDQWRRALPWVLLGKRVAFQPDLDASSALLAFGRSPLIPGQCLGEPGPPLTSVQTKALLEELYRLEANPAMPTSSVPNKKDITNTDDVTHVYVKVEEPQGLSPKFEGPYKVMSRPSRSQVQVRLGSFVNGEPRLATFHWSSCKPAHFREAPVEAERPKLGRKPDPDTRPVAPATPDQPLSRSRPVRATRNPNPQYIEAVVRSHASNAVWTPSSCKHQGQEPTWRDPTQYPGKSRPGEIRSNIQTHGQAEKESLEE